MTENPAVHQLVHTLSYGDAISGETLALKRCFQSAGVNSKIFAINIHPKLVSEAEPIERFRARAGERVILHYSLGSPLNEIYRGLQGVRRALVYHNLTPAKWFDGVNPRIVRDIERGVRELPELCAISNNLVADSPFNAGELKALGYNATVLNLPLDPQRWDLEANQGIKSLLASDGCAHIVHVGRLAPNKCIEDIIKAFYFLHHHINRKTKLWLAGIEIDTEVYAFALKRMVYELSLDESVNFVHTFVDAELKALYQRAALYVCMSEHEGFCMPVVEAMYFGVPVLAYGVSALPDTVDSGGILISRKNPAEVAELMNIMCSDDALRARLIEAGKRRCDELSYANFSAKVKDIFLSQPSDDKQKYAQL